MLDPAATPLIAAVALGSNLPSRFGGPADNLRTAVDRMGKLGSILAVSSFQITDPVGFTAQPQFVNGALLLETRFEPVELMEELLRIEREMGRQRVGVPVKGPRIIDLDLIWVDGIVLKTEALTLPHPAMAERAFVLEPLAELAPQWVHPMLGLTVMEMLNELRP
jgi:2-amino-4-hydroxy-6-hydroxymethyldihydropteridine diphosphokinase